VLELSETSGGGQQKRPFGAQEPDTVNIADQRQSGEPQLHHGPNYRDAVAFVILNVILPILLGGGIYTLWRSKTLLVFEWYRWAGVEEPVFALRAYAAPIRHLIPSAFLYSLPDAVWVYSFTALLLFLWRKQPKSIERTLWLALPVALAEGAEIGQYFHIVPGTFDVADLVSNGTAWIAAAMSATVFLQTKPEGMRSSER
jgi:hypothetical protein